MKLSVLAILATATLATASVIPSCDRTDVDSFNEFSLTNLGLSPVICLLPCWRTPRKCAPGWFLKRRATRCWTCCKIPRPPGPPPPPPHPHPTPEPPHAFEFEEEEYDEFDGFDGFDELD